MSRYEMETVITYNDEEETADIFTVNNAMNKNLEKLFLEYPDQVSKISNNRFYIPKKWVKIRPPKKVSEETRNKMSERAKLMLAKRYANKDE